VKLKSASIPKHIPLDDVTLEQALSLLSFPKELGKLDGEPLMVAFGRFGPYLKCGEMTMSLKDRDILALTFEEAQVLLKERKDQKSMAATPLRELGKDPATEGKIVIKDGRFGPYVTDGKTNASLGKKRDPQTITLEEAAELLAAKRARGPSKWKRRG
jgi:DNA topoisomerase-1